MPAFMMGGVVPAFVAVIAGSIAFARISPEAPARVRDTLSATAEALFWVLVIAFVALVIHWLLSTRRGITVLPFEVVGDDNEAQKLTAGLAAELEQIRSLLSAIEPDIVDIQLSPRRSNVRSNVRSKETNSFALPEFTLSQEPFEQVVANVGTLKIGALTLSLGSVLIALKRLTPRRHTTFLVPSIELSDSTVRLRARTQGHRPALLSAWTLTTDLSVPSPDGTKRTLQDGLRQFAFEIAKDLAPGINIQEGTTFKQFMECLRCLHAYSVKQDRGMLRKAVGHWRAGADAEPTCEDFAVLAYTLGIALLNEGDPSGAADMFEKAASVKKGDARPWLGLGVARYDLGFFDDAEKDYKTALILDRADKHARNNLAELYRLQGDLDAGIEQCGKALKADARFSHAHLTLGSLLTAKGDTYAPLGWCNRAARRYYSRAARHYILAIKIIKKQSRRSGRPLRAYPQYAYAWNGLGIVLAKQEDFGGAIECHRQALAHNQRDWFFWHNLGNARAFQANVERAQDRRKKRYHNARDALERARVLHGAYAWTDYRLAEVYTALGQRDAARDAFDRALKFSLCREQRGGCGGADPRLQPPGTAGSAGATGWTGQILEKIYRGYAYDAAGGQVEASEVFRSVLDAVKPRSRGSSWVGRLLTDGRSGRTVQHAAVDPSSGRRFLFPRRSAALMQGNDLGTHEGSEIAAFAGQRDVLFRHVLSGMDSWLRGELDTARRHMRKASRLAQFSRARTPRNLRVDRVVLTAIALLVLGRTQEALRVGRRAVPDAPHRPFHGSLLWLCLLLGQGPPLAGLDELRSVLGYPSGTDADQQPPTLASEDRPRKSSPPGRRRRVRRARLAHHTRRRP